MQYFFASLRYAVLIMFQYSSVSLECGNRALIGSLIVDITRINSDELSSRNIQDISRGINLAGFSIDRSKI